MAGRAPPICIKPSRQSIWCERRCEFRWYGGGASLRGHMRRTSIISTISFGSIVVLLLSSVAHVQERRDRPDKEIVKENVGGQDVAAREALVVLRRPLR